MCLSLIVVCSVGTLAVNANPLLRYDGYYLLADWLEVPNLAERAAALSPARGGGGCWANRRPAIRSSARASAAHSGSTRFCRRSISRWCSLACLSSR